MRSCLPQGNLSVEQELEIYGEYFGVEVPQMAN